MYSGVDLLAEFRYKPTRLAVPQDYVRWEREVRSRTGFLVPYQCVEVDAMARKARMGRYVPVPKHFAYLEVPRGCLAELPPILTYRSSKLLDFSSGFWTMFHTEWALNCAVSCCGGCPKLFSAGLSSSPCTAG